MGYNSSLTGAQIEEAVAKAPWIISESILNVTDDKSVEEVLAMFGVSTTDELVAKLDAAVPTFLKSSGVVVPAQIKYLKVGSICFLYISCFSDNSTISAVGKSPSVIYKDVTIRPSSVTATERTVVSLNNEHSIPTAIINLTSDSTSDQISEAIGGKTGFNNIVAAIKAGKRLVMRGTQSSANSDPLYISANINAICSDTAVSLSCDFPYYANSYFGGFYTISYENGTFTASVQGSN